MRIFRRLKRLLRQYEGPLTARPDRDGRYELWSEKPVVIQGRRKEGVYFAGLIIQRGYVGLYYMPVYAEPEQKRFFPPELLKLRKGKSCFHFRALDAGLERQVRDTLARGYRLYRDKGWV